MEPQRMREGAPSTRSVEPKVAAIRARVIRVWQRRSGARSSARSPDAGWEQRLESLAARVVHLEAEIEGLQDAVYRQAVLEQEKIGDLRRRTDPEQLARDLGQDAEGVGYDGRFAHAAWLGSENSRGPPRRNARLVAPSEHDVRRDDAERLDRLGD